MRKEKSASNQPNVICFHVDNLGYGELGCYGGGILRGAESGIVAWERTLGDVFSDAGYATMCTGKWHIGDCDGRWPTDHGFEEKLFIGWFGPRGLASIVFAVIVLHENLPGGGTMVITVVCTVALSIIAHGISANPLVAALGARRRRSEGKAGADE